MHWFLHDLMFYIKQIKARYLVDYRNLFIKKYCSLFEFRWQTGRNMLKHWDPTGAVSR